MNHFITDDGEKIHLAITGDGPPLVLLHGWTADHREWSPFIHALSEHHCVYRWDARGHGHHDLSSSSVPNVQRMARDLANLLDHYQLEHAVVLGHSMGALTLWQYIGDHGTERLAKLCIIDQSPKLVTDDDWHDGIYGNFSATQSEAFLERLRRDFAENVLRLIADGLNSQAKEKYLENTRGWQKSRALLQSFKPEPLIACWESLTHADYRPVLARIDIPTLLIYGGASNFYRRATAEYVASQIRGSDLRIYEDTDHSPHLWARDRFVRDLLEFIRRP